MIIDKDNLFCDKQAVTSSEVNTSALDLGAAGDAIGQELTLHAVAAVTFTGGTSLAINLQTSADNGSSDAYTTVVSVPAVPLASLKAGKDVFCVRVPQGTKRYIRLNLVPSGTFTAGKITAFASKDL